MWDKTVLKTISMLEVELQELFISKPVMQCTPSWPRALNSWVSLHVGSLPIHFPINSEASLSQKVCVIAFIFVGPRILPSRGHL